MFILLLFLSAQQIFTMKKNLIKFIVVHNLGNRCHHRRRGQTSDCGHAAHNCLSNVAIDPLFVDVTWPQNLIVVFSWVDSLVHTLCPHDATQYQSCWPPGVTWPPDMILGSDIFDKGCAHIGHNTRVLHGPCKSKDLMTSWLIL